jgi:beta-galactosidase
LIRTDFNQGWSVNKAGSAEVIGPVTLPYDAMLFEERDPSTRNSHNTGFFPGGVYRYSKTFVVPEQWRGRSVTLEFEGVYMRSEVRVNGTLVGGRPSGYAVFHVALDDALAHGAENLVEVVAHNDDMPNSRWYSGSGIYRPVYLLVGERLHVTPHGLRVTTASLKGAEAEVDVATAVVNDGPERRDVTLSVRLTSPSGVVTNAPEVLLALESGESTTVRRAITVHAAEPWSTETPRLYSAQAWLKDAGEVIDEAITDFGIRTVSVDVARGLRINGRPIKLRGACIHHDNGVIGAHTLDAAEDRRIRLLKSGGYNAIRSAHNPASSATLRACDRHGVLVMDELTDAWWRPKVTFDVSHEFEQWWEQDLAAMVAKDVNHPSVIMYSIGNEIGETATERGVQLNRRLDERTRELDPTRLTTNCINGFLNLIGPRDDEKLAAKNAASRESGESTNKNLILVLNYLLAVLEKVLPYIVRLSGVDRRTRDAYAAVDVAGYNYMQGRYRKDARLHPHRVIVGSETNPNEAVAIWRQIEHLPHVIGDFTWTGWDYLGEAGYAAVKYHERRQIFSPWPGLTAGMPNFDITGHRQTQSYLNAIAWHLTQGPHLAVQPVNHAGQKRTTRAGRTDSIRSWSWEGYERRVATVEVYADAQRVELLLDGKRLGNERVGKRRPYLAEFSLPYRPGELTAIAYRADGTEIGRDTLVSAGQRLRLSVHPETEELKADGSDLAYLPIELTDEVGVLRPLADRTVLVEVSGAGSLLGFGSGEPINDEGFARRQHTTYYGRALAVVRAGHEPGEVTVTVKAEGCEPTTTIIPVVRTT